ncbi:hypothetical protein F0562_029134 [Nyssa sinensis]|uniref:Uncharacterized protein n=1 Tax=Nyssa sinensis TaxID=561372 RepID=A0A5J5B335_9ASTE|nr:hypothetical protein F0562_029134 [Nyssa sinensis]
MLLRKDTNIDRYRETEREEGPGETCSNPGGLVEGSVRGPTGVKYKSADGVDHHATDIEHRSGGEYIEICPKRRRPPAPPGICFSAGSNSEHSDATWNTPPPANASTAPETAYASRMSITPSRRRALESGST